MQCIIVGLGKLLNKQTISIDNHILGSLMLWNKGMHIHKKMNATSDILADINIPLSNNQDYTIEIKHNRSKRGRTRKEKNYIPNKECSKRQRKKNSFCKRST